MPENKSANTKSGEWSKILLLTPLLVLLIATLGFLVWKNATTKPLSLSAPEYVDLPETPPPLQTDTTETEAPSLPEEPALPEFNPQAMASTEPGVLISGTDIMVNGEIVESYETSELIDFTLPEDYANLPGILTFRGNNFRDSASYGTVSLHDGKFSQTDKWSVPTGSLQAPDGAVWTGSGWVGQPLMMTWPRQVRANMNMYDWAKNADTLTEVIYATMDGNIYFIDLETGNKTRDNMYLGFTFKGAGALDPRGYPILYLGAGYQSNKGASRAFVINLLDCSVMYEFGHGDTFSLRSSVSFFDGSALVDAETDKLIYPGENGVLYIIKLNTSYDAQGGLLSIAPSDVVKWRYKGIRSSGSSYWLGMEDSPVIWRGHIIMADNGGHLMCLDLNTLQLKWVQDVLDDTNCTPVLELEDGHPYVYISTSFHGGWRAPTSGTANIPIWKIDAITGEIVWQKDYDCYTQEGVSGGAQGTLAIGKNSLSDLVFVPVARTPGPGNGVLVALNKQTGSVVWEIVTEAYSWSSPVAVYDNEGKGYLVFCTSGGYMYLIDGITGTVMDSLNLGGNVEASPAVYNGTVVVGTRSQTILGVKIV